MSDFGDEGELVPDLPEPIRAYRAWSHDGTRLLGMGEIIWPAGEPLKARCQSIAPPPERGYHRRSRQMSHYAISGYIEPEPRVHVHDCPSPNADGHNGYGCGIYAYRDSTRFVGQPGFYVDQERGAGQVIGCVELGGKVYEHQHGYRAEYAMPVCFYGDPTDPTLTMLASVYDVPIEPAPWEDPEVIRRRINEQAQEQAQKWDREIDRAKARAARPRQSPELRTSVSVDWSDRVGEAAEDDPASQQYPNAAGFSDARIEEMAKQWDASPRLVVSCLNDRPRWGQTRKSRLPKRDQYHDTYGTDHPLRKAWKMPFGLRMCALGGGLNGAVVVTFLLLHIAPIVNGPLTLVYLVRAAYVWRRYGRG